MVGRSFSSLFIAAMLVSLVTVPASADITASVYGNTSIYEIKAVASDTTTAADLTGAVARIFYSSSNGGSGGSLTATFAQVSNVAEAYSPGFFTLVYDPTINSWLLSADPNLVQYRIYAFEIDAGAGNCVFDLEFLPPTLSTTGSGPGLWPVMSIPATGFVSPTTVLTLNTPVALQGSPPAGDLYRSLNFRFTNSNEFLTANQKVFIKADIDPVIEVNSVPEPGTLLLISSGLLGLFGFRRKVKK